MADKTMEKLHNVLANRHGSAAVEQVQQLLSSDRAIAARQAKNGDTPLHWALRFQCGDEAATIVQALLAAYPQAARTANDAGILPIHVAAEHQGGEQGAAVVEMLLKIAPETALIGDGYRGNWLPLQLAAMAQGGAKGVAVLEVLLRAAPQAAFVHDKNGCLPLHTASIMQDDKKGTMVVQALLKAAPSTALIANNKNGDLALHAAAGNQQGIAVVEALLQAAPEAARRVNNAGKTPLHSVTSVAVAEALIRVAPETLYLADAAGFVPLHYACQSENLRLIRTLLQAAPEAARLPTSNGSLPLHLAVANDDRHASAVKLLLNAWPEAALRSNNYGYPLHCAVAAGSCRAIIQRLIRAAPQALLPLGGVENAALDVYDGRDVQALVLLLNAAPHVLFACDEEEYWPRESSLYWRLVGKQGNAAKRLFRTYICKTARALNSAKYDCIFAPSLRVRSFKLLLAITAQPVERRSSPLLHAVRRQFLARTFRG